MLKITIEDENKKETVFESEAELLFFAAMDSEKDVKSGIVGFSNPFKLALLFRSVFDSAKRILGEDSETEELVKLIAGLEKITGKTVFHTNEERRNENA